MEKEKFDEILANVPGSFIAKIERIRRYLHIEKVSVMVGAGFSRNANVPSHIKVKQWNDVGKDIYCRLRNVDVPDPNDLIFKTPMRLASQFAASFGRNELDNLIRDAIPDERMSPGSLHQALLNLPWRDVFTTNYDTLLERARAGLVRSYSTVTSKEMLLYKKSPRIIKLHGSFPDKTPFLMTEEEYKNYPIDHPEFVNTVRQALVESIFCLIGFSGDDPNFTSWQSWLRDVMGDYAGPSYLITYDKNYDDTFKTLMNQRGIEVLNFSEVKGLDDHRTALDFFFTYLSKREQEWTGYVHYNAYHVNAEKLIAQMQKVRLSYPGWFILPKKYYSNMDDTIHQFPSLETTIQNMDPRYKEPLLFELDWRLDLALSFKDFDWYRENLESVIHSYANQPFSSKAISLGLSLLRLYRHHPDKHDDIDSLYERLRKEIPRMDSHQTNRFYYIAACNALSTLDYATITAILAEWQPAPSCYEGIIYKALVLAESHNLSAATELLSDALERITQSLIQTTSSEELSLRCVMESLLDLYNSRQMNSVDPNFSFNEISNSIWQKITELDKPHFEVKHGFGIGTIQKSWRSYSGTAPELLYPYRYLLLYEAYGVPYSINGISINEQTLSQLFHQIATFGLHYSLGAVLRNGSRKVTTTYADRTSLNTLNRESADKLAMALLKTVQQSTLEKVQQNKEIRVLLPFLARLTSLCSETVVINIYKFALKTYLKSLTSEKEDLNIIYSNTLPACIQEIYTEAFSSTLSHKFDIPLPKNGYKYYKPGKTEIDITANALDAKDTKVQEAAYYRAEYLLQAQIDDNSKKTLVLKIRAWRAKATPSILTRHSYTLVAPSKSELNTLESSLKEYIKSFLGADFKCNGGSSSISSLESYLRSLTFLVSFLNDKQISAILKKLADTLDKNYDKFSIDDSKGIWGGLRFFTYSVYKQTSEFVCAILNEGFSNKKPCQELFDVLEKYLPSKLPVRMTMERLNSISHKVDANKMREIITANLFSETKTDVIDSCEALIFHANNGGAVQKTLQNIIFYCNHGDTDKMLPYLQTLKQIHYSKMSKSTRNQLAEMMENILKRIPQQNIREEQKVDIMHAGVRLAAALKKETSDKTIAKAIKAWEDYANDKNVYNDVRRPWFIN